MIPPGLVFASQTSYSKPQTFQNKPQKEGVNFPFGFCLSQNRSALCWLGPLLISRFPPTLARFLSSLHPLLIFSYFMSCLATLQSPSPGHVVPPHSGRRTEAGWRRIRGQEDAETWCCLLRQSKGQQWVRGAKLCLFSCLCCPCTGLSVFGLWKPQSCAPTVLLGTLLGLVSAHEIPADHCCGVCVLLVFPFPLPGHLQITQHNHGFPCFRFLFRERFHKVAQALPLSPLWVTCTLYNRRMVAPPLRSSLQHHHGPTSAPHCLSFPIQSSGDWDEGAHCL